VQLEVHCIIILLDGHEIEQNPQPIQRFSDIILETVSDIFY
jgi:hypothetical protein